MISHPADYLEAFAKAGYETLAGGSYRSMWWVFHNRHGAFAARCQCLRQRVMVGR